MPASARVVVGLLLLVACSQACAQSASFGVSMRVLPERPTTDGPIELPAPPGAQLLPPSRDAKRLLYKGSADEAKRFYAAALPNLGFFLMRQSADGQVWERADVRAELQFYPVLGEQKAAGIYLTIVRNSGASAPAMGDIE